MKGINLRRFTQASRTFERERSWVPLPGPADRKPLDQVIFASDPLCVRRRGAFLVFCGDCTGGGGTRSSPSPRIRAWSERSDGIRSDVDTKNQWQYATSTNRVSTFVRDAFE